MTMTQVPSLFRTPVPGALPYRNVHSTEPGDFLMARGEMKRALAADVYDKPRAPTTL